MFQQRNTGISSSRMLLTWAKGPAVKRSTETQLLFLGPASHSVTLQTAPLYVEMNCLAKDKICVFFASSIQFFPLTHFLPNFNSSSSMHTLLIVKPIDCYSLKMSWCTKIYVDTWWIAKTIKIIPMYLSGFVSVIRYFMLLVVFFWYFTKAVSPPGLVLIGNLGMHA